MTKFKRYAVFHALPAGPLAEFAASWLGWDPVQGCAVAHPEIRDLTLPVTEITATPRKYGFHGTIKPPFRLTESSSEAALITDLRALARHTPRLTLTGLELSRLGRFLALTVIGDQSSLSDLAARVVKGLDHHRAPLTDEELQRRKAGGISTRQEELLLKWGYPYVLDQFRFHMTLTGKLPKQDVIKVQDILSPLTGELLPKPFELEKLSLFGEAEDGMFYEIGRFPLAGGCST